MSRRDAAWLADILSAIDAVGDYLKQGSLDEGLVYDACRARLIEIGEAVKHLDPALVAAAPAVRWRAIPGCETNSPITASTPTTPWSATWSTKSWPR